MRAIELQEIPSDWLTSKQVASRLGHTTPGRATALARAGVLRTVKSRVGKAHLLYYDPASVDSYLRDGGKIPAVPVKTVKTARVVTGDMVTAPQAAKLLGLHPTHVRNLVQNGRLIGTVAPNGRYSIARASIATYVPVRSGRKAGNRKKRPALPPPRSVRQRLDAATRLLERSKEPVPARAGTLGRIEEKLDMLSGAVMLLPGGDTATVLLPRTDAALKVTGRLAWAEAYMQLVATVFGMEKNIGRVRQMPIVALADVAHKKYAAAGRTTFPKTCALIRRINWDTCVPKHTVQFYPMMVEKIQRRWR